MNVSQIGVCGWCLDRDDVLRGIETAGRVLGVDLVQIGFFSAKALRSADPSSIGAAADAAGVSLVGAFVAFEGEDYSTQKRLAATGGLAPDDMYTSRLESIRTAARLSAAVDCKHVAIHGGTIPTAGSSSSLRKLVSRIREAADIAGEHGLRLLLETGREPAAVLRDLLDELDRDNVGVSFDTGNFVIYGTDAPAQSVSRLSGLIDVVHMKDAVPPAAADVEYGRGVPLGSGDAAIPRVLSKLRAARYDGPILIECSADHSDSATILGAVAYLRSMLG